MFFIKKRTKLETHGIQKRETEIAHNFKLRGETKGVQENRKVLEADANCIISNFRLEKPLSKEDENIQEKRAFGPRPRNCKTKEVSPVCQPSAIVDFDGSSLEISNIQNRGNHTSMNNLRSPYRLSNFGHRVTAKHLIEKRPIKLNYSVEPKGEFPTYLNTELFDQFTRHSIGALEHNSSLSRLRDKNQKIIKFRLNRAGIPPNHNLNRPQLNC